MLNLAHACVTEHLNGPGRRFTVWVQGCARSCPGCFNPGLRAFEPRRLVAPGALAEEARASGPLDGVSLSGGEPFDQAPALTGFLDALRARPGVGDLTVLAFTGYRVDELRCGAPAHRALLARLDLVIDGAYRSELASELPLRGSSNQRLVALSPAGERLRAAAEAAGPARFEVVIAGDGEVLFTGFPPVELVARVRGRLDPPG